MALFQYWNRLREGRRAPTRAEIEPADIKTLLADTFILERDARKEAIFRLAGTRLCAIYGRELKGFSFVSLWREKDRDLAGRLADAGFAAKSVSVTSFDGISRSGEVNPFELLILPLDGGQEHPRCLGMVTAAAKPYWLGADPIVELRIDGVRFIDPDREPFLADKTSDAAPLFGNNGRNAAGPGGHGRQIRHLMVLDGGRRKPD